MNQLEIRTFLLKLEQQADTRLDEVYARLLQTILQDVNKMYAKYQKDGVLSYTDLNKYNRLQSTFEQIIENTTAEYQTVIREINSLREMVYVQNYLRTAYVLEMFTATEMGFVLPSVNTIRQALANPIEHLNIHPTMEKHRNAIVEDIQTVITQGVLRGSSYWVIAKELETKLNFHKNKAKTVARTETGRAQSMSSESVYEQASKHANLTKVWVSSLDLQVRIAHRQLDGQRADADGYFHHAGLKAIGPHMWHKPDMDINCRCIILYLVDGMLPSVRKGRDYTDAAYQEKLQAMIEQLVDEGVPFGKAIKQALDRVKPPSKVMDGFITYEEYEAKMTA